MRAAVFRKVNTPFEIEEVTLDKPRGREVLIRTKASGICHSDYHFYKGLYPYPASDDPRTRGGRCGGSGG